MSGIFNSRPLYKCSIGGAAADAKGRMALEAAERGEERKAKQKNAMKTPATIFLLLLFSLAIAFISMPSPEDFFQGSEYDVRVINGFTSNSSLPLVIWCVSDDGPLGGRALQDGEDFGWTVKTKFFDRRRYVCTMKWDGVRKRFDAFSGARDIGRCIPTKKCSWLVREDGFYFSNDETNWKREFSWP